MALTPGDAAAVEERASELYEIRQREARRLQHLRLYLDGQPELTWLPHGTPKELQALARMARVNVAHIAVRNTTQQLFVDGYQHADTTAGPEIWGIWQANRWDKKQIGVHKAVAGYGVAYGVGMPDDNGGRPVMRPSSPHAMTTGYAEAEDDWPQAALERRAGGEWWLYDDTHRYTLRRGNRRTAASGRTITFNYVPDSEVDHGQGVTPVVRYLADEDLDNPLAGDIEPILTLQDQINLITFHLLVAEHYGAHGRKIFIGKMVEQLEQQLQSSAASTLTITASPEDFRVDEVGQTQLDGFIQSREAAAKFLAAISQTPTQELLGSLANLSAAALIESRESTMRKLLERQVVVGEGHEQLLGLVGELAGQPYDSAARVIWQPQRGQRMTQLVAMLGDIATRLGVPKKALWKELPFSQSTVDEWERAWEEGQAAQAGGDGPSPDEDDGGVSDSEAEEISAAAAA